MEELDGDDVLVFNSSGKKAARDIVQFVEFNRYKGDLPSLGEEVLRELPE
jgi:hypothetical protein